MYVLGKHLCMLISAYGYTAIGMCTAESHLQVYAASNNEGTERQSFLIFTRPICHLFLIVTSIINNYMQLI